MNPRRALGLAVGAVAAQRVGELAWSRRNEHRLRARGAVEHGAAHYPWMVALHTTWIIATAIEGRRCARVSRAWLATFLAAQPLRWWVLATLADRWTTRVLVVDDPPVRRGPYRFVRHPNYAVVAIEVATLPAAFGAWTTAALGSIANAAVLRRRIAVEDAALAGSSDAAPGVARFDSRQRTPPTAP